MFYWPGPESDSMQVVLDWYIENVTPTSGIKPELILPGRMGYYEKLDVVVAGASSEIDAFMNCSYTVRKYAPYAEDLNEYFAKPELAGDGSPDIFIPKVLDMLTVDGKLCAIPTDGTPNVLIYRKDLIERLLTDATWQALYRKIAVRELGRDLLPKDPMDWTWDDFLATALFFSKSQNPDSPTTYGTALQCRAMFPNGKIVSAIMRSMGGSWFDEAGNPAFDTPVGRRALGIYETIMAKDASSTACVTYEYMEPNEAMKTGEAAMITQWSVAYNELSDPESSPLIWDKVAIAPHPAGDAEHVVWVTALDMSLSKFSEHKEETFKFLAFLSTVDAMRMYAENGGNAPVESVMLELGDESPLPLYNLEYIDKYAFSFTAPDGKTIGVLTILAQYASEVCAKTMTAGEAAAAIQADVEALLAD